MSTNVRIFVEHYDDDKHKWESIIPIINGKEVWFWEPNATYEIFDCLKKYGRCIGDADIETFSPRVKEVYEDDFEDGGYEFKIWNLADMMNYFYEHPSTTNYDAEPLNEDGDYPIIINPIKAIIDKAKFYYDELGGYWWKEFSYSSVRLVYWFC